MSFRETVRKAMDAAMSGDSVVEYNEVLLRVAAMAVAITDTAHGQSFLRRCQSIFNQVQSIDLSDKAESLSVRDLIENLGIATIRLLYFEPVYSGAPVLPLVPGASVKDNRVFLIIGLLVAYKDEFDKKFVEVAAMVSWQRACSEELAKRFSHLGKHVLPLVSMIISPRDMRMNDYRSLVDGARPRHWRNLAAQLPIHQADKAEIDSLFGLILGTESTKHVKWSIAGVALKALEGGFDFLPKRIRDRIISEIRSGKAKKRPPPGGAESLEKSGDVPTPVHRESHSSEEIERIVRAAAPELREAYGPKAVEVILAYLLEPDANQSLIAQRTNLSDRQVRAYKSKFRVNPDPIMRLFNAP